MVGIEAGFLDSDEGGGGGAVVSVGYVQRWYRSKQFSDAAYGVFIVNHPEVMTESVCRHEVIFRCCGGHILYYSFKLFIVRESEEHRFDIGVVYAHVFHAVLFFVAAGELMLFDSAFHVVGDIGGDYESILCSAVHCLGVDIVMFLVVLHKPSVLLERVEVGNCLVIDFRCVLIHARFKIYFRLDNVIE